MIGSASRGDGGVSEVVSIVGPGTTFEGDCDSDGTLRVEGRLEGTIRAARAVVVGEEGSVVGDVHTRDAVIAGQVEGTVVAENRVEVRETARVEGDIRCRRLKLEEGGIVDGRLEMGEVPEGQEGGGSPQSSTGQGRATGVGA